MGRQRLRAEQRLSIQHQVRRRWSQSYRRSVGWHLRWVAENHRHGDGRRQQCDPTRAISVFRILSATNIASGDVVTWSAVTGKGYQPQWSSALGAGWQNLSSPVNAGLSDTSLTI